jgi:hypothetical protein
MPRKHSLTTFQTPDAAIVRTTLRWAYIKLEKCSSHIPQMWILG